MAGFDGEDDGDAGSAGQQRPADRSPGRTPASPNPAPSGWPPDDAEASATAPDGEKPWRAGGLTVSEPAEFIAAVPALLGFRPRRSVVACLLLPSRTYPDSVYLGAVARHDLDVPGCGGWMRLADHLAAICGQENAVGIVILIVDDGATAPRPGRAGRRAGRHHDLIRVLDGTLGPRDVAIADVWAVPDIEAGAPWWSVLDSRSRGDQLDPSASPVAVAQVLDGRAIRESRSELTDAVAADAHLCARVEAVLGDAAEVARRRFERAVRTGEPRTYSRAALKMVLEQIGTVAAGDTLEAREIADLAVAVRDTAVRDALFAVALGEHAAAAETLWSRACRGLTGADRAELATLFGYSAYTRGDGPLAGVAFDAALAADPGHRIAHLLDAALRTGMRPDDVRKLAGSGRDTAAGLGVDIPIVPALTRAIGERW
ncbi:MAG: DUF4192 domain-containing protein [Nocardia sp.]|nr:DUF4192 domain-containing protein [Nocardia sp.]